MKAKEIISEEEVKTMEGCCVLCELHSVASVKIPDAIICPKCGAEQPVTQFLGVINPSDIEDNFTVVGGHNAYDPEEEINKYLVSDCNKCGESIALIPHHVMHNGNHDVYYTGADKYLNEDIKGIQEAILPSIKQYTDRILNGEDKLDPWHLALWISRDIEGLVAKYLFDHGFKK